MNIDILKSKNAYIPEENTIFYRFISQTNLSSHLDWNNFDISTIFKEKSDFLFLLNHLHVGFYPDPMH